MEAIAVRCNTTRRIIAVPHTVEEAEKIAAAWPSGANLDIVRGAGTHGGKVE